MPDNNVTNTVVTYANWKSEYRYLLNILHSKKVIMLFSGGKDSSLIMDFISRAGEEYGFDFEVHAGAFPKHRYPEYEKERIDSYWKRRDVDIIWHEFKETDEQIRDSDNPCIACQAIRKKLLKKIVAEKSCDLDKLLLLVGFSLWDIVGYSMERILGEIYSNSGNSDHTFISKRFMETAQRFYPMLKMDDGYTVFRPLIKYNGSHIAAAIEDLGIPVNSISCEFREYRPKRLLENYYEKMGLEFDYDSVFEFAKSSLGLPDMASYSLIDKDKYLKEYF